MLADERTEWALLTVALLSGLASLVPSYIRHHHRGRGLWWFAAESLLLVVPKVWLSESAGTRILFVLGGAALAVGHRINAWLCRECAVCED